MKSWAVPEIWKTQLWQPLRLAPWLRARCMHETRKHPGPPKPIIGQLPASFNFVMKLESLGTQSCNHESTARRGNMCFSTAIHRNAGTQHRYTGTPELKGGHRLAQHTDAEHERSARPSTQVFYHVRAAAAARWAWAARKDRPSPHGASTK